MKTIYDPDAKTVKQASLAIFLMTITIGIMGPASFSGGWLIYGGVSLSAFIYMLYIRYRCESYTFFTMSYFTLLIFLLAFAPACVSYITITKDLNGSDITGFFSALLLLSSIMGLHFIIYLTPQKDLPFLIVGNKVSFNAPETSSLKTSIAAGLGTLAASTTVSLFTPFTTGILIIFLFLFICIFMLIHSRHLIRGLRKLRVKERNLPTPYTFMQIDEIRESRSRGWLGRVFKSVFPSHK